MVKWYDAYNYVRLLFGRLILNGPKQVPRWSETSAFCRFRDCWKFFPWRRLFENIFKLNKLPKTIMEICRLNFAHHDDFGDVIWWPHFLTSFADELTMPCSLIRNPYCLHRARNNTVKSFILQLMWNPTSLVQHDTQCLITFTSSMSVRVCLVNSLNIDRVTNILTLSFWVRAPRYEA